jgi:hypothetical protein
VFFVTSDTRRFLKKVEERQEGGTPDIVGSIRAALAFKVALLRCRFFSFLVAAAADPPLAQGISG